ncbi:MAG: glutaredoxin [Bacilli bacterium]
MTDCPHCKMAERLLDKANIRYEKINWDTESGEEIIRSLKIKTVPVLLIPTKDGFETVRGEVEINKLIKTGKLQNR